jgi:microcystin degradation protein MlrC
MRVFTATLGTETNTFSPLPTALRAFRERMFWRPGEHPDYPSEQTGPLWICRQRKKTRGWDVVEGSCMFAAPAGPVMRLAYESMRDEILAQLEEALPVDMVAIGMHGAMVAEGYPDCEGDMMQKIREMVGADVPIGLEIDPHCHLSARMVDNATAIIAFKEYPHFDYLERAEELIDILVATRRGVLNPRMTVFDCRMIGTFHTTVEPMKSFLDELRSFEGKKGVCSISVIHGFPWGDVPDLGTKILVVADAAASSPGKLAEYLGRKLFDLRGQTSPAYLTFEQALEQAIKIDGGPVVIADSADNPGGGAPGDASYFLREVMDRGLRDVCVGPLYDPLALQVVFDAGEGAVLPLRFGGKLGPGSGVPIDARVKVNKLCRGAVQTFAGAPEPIGDAAAVSFEGIDVVLTSVRCQALGTDLFSSMGIDPESRKIVIVKSSQHFYSAFAPISRKVLYTADQGALNADLTSLPYKNISRPRWPLDENPFPDS